MYIRISTYTLLLTLLFNFLCSVAWAQHEYKMRKPQSSYDASHSYYVGLLRLALEETEAEHSKAKISFETNVNQGRELIELESGKIINVAMFGTNPDREKNLIPIRIPLNKGVLGYRVFIIHKDSKSDFDNIKSLNELRMKTACQGEHWPDSDILEAAQIRVIRNQDYESMFDQLVHMRCDFFPRGINEGFVEMAARARSHPELMIYERLVLTYTFPMYFFVSPRYPHLANRLKKGMLSLHEQGKLDTYIQEHPVTRDLFPLNKWKDTLELNIDNPFLPEETPLDDQRLWLEMPFKQPKVLE